MRIGGIATGLDTEQIINELMQAERIPLDKLLQEREWVSWQREAYREVNSSIRAFREGPTQQMRLQSTFIGYEVRSGADHVATATATSAAMPGSYRVDVTQLAEAASLRSEHAITMDTDMTDGEGNTIQQQVTSFTNFFEASGLDEQLENLEENEDGRKVYSFSIRNGDLEAEIEITEDDHFASVARKIAEATAHVDEGGESTSQTLGLQANFDDTTGRFFISTRETGENQNIQFSADEVVGRYILGLEYDGDGPVLPGGDDGEQEIRQEDGFFRTDGTNAAFTFNGIDIENESNSVSVNGMNITLTGTGETTLHVQSNPDDVVESITEFVEEYNALIDDLQGRLNEPRYRDYPPLTEEQRSELTEREAELWDEKAESGLLRNDRQLQTLLFDMRRAFSDPVEGIPEGQIRSLSQIGITTSDNWRDGGKLEIDENRLRQAVADNPNEVMELFRKVPEEDDQQAQMGIARRVNEQLRQAESTLRERAGSEGVELGDQSTLGRNLRDIDDQILRFEQRMQQVEERYWRQFTALERSMNQLNQQSDWMYQNMLGGMGGM